jgi:hypothetical protein
MITTMKILQILSIIGLIFSLGLTACDSDESPIVEVLTAEPNFQIEQATQGGGLAETTSSGLYNITAQISMPVAETASENYDLVSSQLTFSN